MKYTAITDGGKYGVQPTMEKPEIHEYRRDIHGDEAYRDDMREYESHLLALPRYLRTGGLEELPDGAEFEAKIVKQFLVGKDWEECTKEEYKTTFEDSRREVLAPLVKDQDVASVHQDSSPVASHSSASGNSDEPLREFFKLSSIPVVDRYFKETNSIYHDYKYQVAIEKFAAWLRDGQTPLQKSAQKTIDIGYHGNFTAMQILADQCNAHDTGLESIQQKAAIRAMEIYASNKLPNSEQNVQECDASKADQGTKAGNQKPVEQEGTIVNFKIPTAALKYALGYFGKKTMPEFIDSAKDEDKWLLDELSKAYEEGAKWMREYEQLAKLAALNKTGGNV